MKMKNLFLHGSFWSLVLLITGCSSDPQSRYEYMPDMYRGPAVETYMDYQNPNQLSAKAPVEGTVPFARGNGRKPDPELMPYPFPNTNDGYEKAGDTLKNPIGLDEKTWLKGEDLYLRFCEHCHGEDGSGQGPIVKSGKFPPPPPYDGRIKDLSDGKIFHSITYGKNLMPGHADQLSKKERWKLVHYVNTLQEGGGNPFK